MLKKITITKLIVKALLVLTLCGAYAIPAAAVPGTEEYFNDSKASSEALERFSAFADSLVSKSAAHGGAAAAPTDSAGATGGAAAMADGGGATMPPTDLSDTDIQALFPRLAGNKAAVLAFLNKFAPAFKGGEWGYNTEGHKELVICCLPLKNIAFLTLKQLDEIINKCSNRSAEIVHTTFLGGGMLPTYMLVDALVSIGGYNNITIYNVADCRGYSFEKVTKEEHANAKITLQNFASVPEYIDAVKAGKAKKSMSFDMIDAGGIEVPDAPGEHNFLQCSSRLKFFYSSYLPYSIAIIHKKCLLGKNEEKKDSEQRALIKKLEELHATKSDFDTANKTLLKFAGTPDSPLTGIEKFYTSHSTLLEFAAIIENGKSDGNPIVYEAYGCDTPACSMKGAVIRHFESYQIMDRLKKHFNGADVIFHMFNHSDGGGAAS